MDFSSVTGITTQADLDAARSTQKDQLDRQAFLKLFTTQLQNQNPLDPVKNEAFVAQLAQFSTLEATTDMASSLASFVSERKDEGFGQASSLIGKKVDIRGGYFSHISGEKSEGFITLASPAEQVEVNVLDPVTGQLVSHINLGPQHSGEIPFIWNGGDNKGRPAASGDYLFSVNTIQGGKRIAMEPSAMVRVSGISWNREIGETSLDLANGYSVSLSSVQKISE